MRAQDCYIGWPWFCKLWFSIVHRVIVYGIFRFVNDLSCKIFNYFITVTLENLEGINFLLGICCATVCKYNTDTLIFAARLQLVLHKHFPSELFT